MGLGSRTPRVDKRKLAELCVSRRAAVGRAAANRSTIDCGNGVLPASNQGVKLRAARS